MSATVVKVLKNYSPAAGLRILGPSLYWRFVASGVRALPAIVRDRNIRSVDRHMGAHAKRFVRFGRPFIYDCEHADRTLDAGAANNFAFGIARELYLRDCYFRYLPAELISSIHTVVDIGANRGAFSSMMTTVASRIIAVEADRQLQPVIQHNFVQNNFENFDIEVAFLGEGGEQIDLANQCISMDELFAKYQVRHVDLMKMDIEGSEYALFRAPRWLNKIRAITMEIHPHYGEPAEVVRTLKEHGFTTRVADENLTPVEAGPAASFVYAWR